MAPAVWQHAGRRLLARHLPVEPRRRPLRRLHLLPEGQGERGSMDDLPALHWLRAHHGPRVEPLRPVPGLRLRRLHRHRRLARGTRLKGPPAVRVWGDAPPALVALRQLPALRRPGRALPALGDAAVAVAVVAMQRQRAAHRGGVEARRARRRARLLALLADSDAAPHAEGAQAERADAAHGPAGAPHVRQPRGSGDPVHAVGPSGRPPRHRGGGRPSRRGAGGVVRHLARPHCQLALSGLHPPALSGAARPAPGR
mmetsp:Transcript_45934/g.117459  ORF Transcript_45934/g.117459 Transcript_45934/m.117459 type:complete len:256 (+) Transcript_45934:690-1457(+)